jgi:CRISPR-associated protein Csd2
MINSTITNTQARHDFVLLFDVRDGNPNGDPDAGNMPRVDPETMHGLVTDVCLKRKVRNWIDMTKGKEENFKIYVQHQSILNEHHDRAYETLELPPTKTDKKIIHQARAWMCKNFFDVRMFGAVMTTGDKWCGQVRGPIQMTFARSIDPIVPLDLSITRVAVTRTQDADKPGEMGRKTLVPYGLYQGFGFYTPHFGADTGVTSEDLKHFWESLLNMWDIDRSASRGIMSCRGIYIFSHENSKGNAPAHHLLDRLTIKKKDGVESPRSFDDYEVTLRENNLPEGVTLTKLGVLDAVLV